MSESELSQLEALREELDATKAKLAWFENNPFSALLRSQRRGLMAEELGLKIQEAVNATHDTNQASSIVLTLKVKPTQKGNTGQYFVADTITAKLPSMAPEETLYFGTPEGRLTRQDPSEKADEESVRVSEPAIKFQKRSA